MSVMDLRKLRESGVRPRVHGNGFIQLDLAPGERLHVWGHRKLPRQVVDTSIHDHTFSFMSRVVCGRTVNVTYGLREHYNGSLEIYTTKPRVGEDTALSPIGKRVAVTSRHAAAYGPNDVYRLDRYVFHETMTNCPSATVMTKTVLSVEGRHARVLCYVGAKPDNDFDRNAFDDDLLWSIIKETMGAKVEV